MSAKIFGLLAALCAVTAVAGPDIQNWKTANGARVYFVAAPELPMVDVQVVFDAGSARDAEKPGLALMTNGMLSEGAGEWDADEIANRFEGAGAIFGNSSQRDMAVVGVRSLTDPELLQPSLVTLATLLQQPTFPADVLKREQRRALIALQQQEQAPDAIADKAFYNAVFGNHPYAHDPMGTAESIAAITRDDLDAFHKRYYVGANAVVAIVGAVNRKQAEALAEAVVGGLPPGTAAAAVPEVSSLAQAQTLNVEFPSTQSHIQVGQPGMNRSDPDYFPLYVGNHILGGSGLVSRLSNEVREKRGLSYSTYSYFLPMRRQGPFIMGLQTRNDQSGQALQVMRETLQNFVANGPTERELSEAQRNITGGFALRIASNSKIAEYLAVIGFYDLPLDYLDSFNSKVEAVTLEQVRDAFKRRVHPDKMVTVTVGAAP